MATSKKKGERFSLPVYVKTNDTPEEPHRMTVQVFRSESTKSEPKGDPVRVPGMELEESGSFSEPMTSIERMPRPKAKPADKNTVAIVEVDEVEEGAEHDQPTHAPKRRPIAMTEVVRGAN